MSIVGEYRAALAQLRRTELRFKVDNVTRAYITEVGGLVMTGGPFNADDALELAAWIVEVYHDPEVIDRA